jgi:hypothetical protein
MFRTSSDKIQQTGTTALLLAYFILLVLFSDVLSSWEWVHLEIHSTIETLGGISAILIAMVLLRESREDQSNMLVMVATGFATMGVLDTAHAMSQPGDAFIFLHSVASLAGGFFFSLAWLPYRREKPADLRWIFRGSIILAVSIALRALIYPEDVPKILPLYNGKFTLAAVLINTAASLLFLSSAPKLYRIYRKEKNKRELVLTFLALLFGIAEMIFQFSNPWDGIWWSWHLIRLMAFAAILTIVFRFKHN